MPVMRTDITRSDRGASALLIALSVLVLMGFAAIAIDYGLGTNERRQDQTAADNSTLAAGVELIVSGDLQAAVDSVKTITNDNLGRTVSDQQWIDCTDPDELDRTAADEGLTPATSCISFGESDAGFAWNRIRVRVPKQTTDAVFSRLLGVIGIETDAAAEVELENLLASGAFPAAVFDGAGAGDQFCIKTGTNSNSQSCGSPSTGDFGNFQPYFYTEVAAGNPSSLCTSGNQPAALSRIMADGMDHQLGFTTSVPGSRINGSDCPANGGPAFPDRVDSGSGYSNNDVTNGLIKGGSYDGAFTGRLTRKNWGAPFGNASVFGTSLDNRPLWKYIDTSVINSTDHPDCVDAAAGPATNDGTMETEYQMAQTAMTACLKSANVPDSLFVSDLLDSPRLTIVPMFHQDAPLGNNACCYDIKDFVPVFINGIWTANGPQWTCNGGMTNDTANGFCKHEPGRTGQITIPAVGQQKVDSADAIVLSCGLLPGVDSPDVKCRRVESGGSNVSVFLNIYLVK